MINASANVTQVKMKAFYILYAFITFYETFGKFHSKEDDKRIVMHSDMDLLAQITSLKTETNNLVTEITSLKTEINDLKAQLKQVQSVTGSSSSYIRWGRTECPGNGTSVIYKGYMSGTFISTHLNTPGAGANYVCLADKPSWNHYTDRKDGAVTITGVEYNFSPHRSSAVQIDFFGTFVGSSEAPCVACNVPRDSNIMIPGRRECFDGWTKEYSGYLVTGYSGYVDSSEYACLDRNPEVIPHSGNTDLENNLYFVEAHCGGTLTCPPTLSTGKIL